MQRNELFTNSYTINTQSSQPFSFSSISSVKVATGGGYFNKGNNLNSTMTNFPHFTKILNWSSPSPGNFADQNISTPDLKNGDDNGSLFLNNQSKQA